MAGDRGVKSLRPGDAAAVMTGAPVPGNADGMIMVERSTRLGPDRVRLSGPFDAERRPAIAPRGQDARKGDVVVGAGTQLRPSDLSVLAGVGATPVPVFARPHVELLATGDEIVDAGERPGPAQIRNSNGPFLRALLGSSGWTESVRERRVPDVRSRLRRRVEASTADILVFTGGVSMGEKDYVPEVLEECGFRAHFHRLALKPGKPLLFASKGRGTKARFVFGLPGNPVSVAVTAWEFLLPFLRRMSGAEEPGPAAESAVFPHGVRRRPGLTHFVPVARVQTGSTGNFPAEAAEVEMHGSGDYPALADADGWLVLPANEPEVQPGGVGVVHWIQEPEQPRSQRRLISGRTK